MEKSLSQYFIKQGIILGLLQVVMYYLLYFINRAWLASFWVGILLMVLIIVYPIVAAVRYKKQHEGFITLKEGFMNVFMITFIRGLIATLFTLLLFYVIDTGLENYLKEKIVDNMVTMMKNWNTPDEAIQEAVAKAQAQESQFTIAAQLKGFVYGSVIAAFFGLVVGSIIRKERPVFAETAPSPANDNA